MKIEVRIAPTDEGREFLAPAIGGNRGRLRHCGVRSVNGHFPTWQALHDKVMAAPGIDDDLKREALNLNRDIIAKTSEMGTDTALVFIDLPAQGVPPSDQDVLIWLERVDCLLSGLTGPDCTLHMIGSPPLTSGDAAAEGAATPSAENPDGSAAPKRKQAPLDALADALGQLFPDTHITVRPGLSGGIPPLRLVTTFLQDIGVDPQRMKLHMVPPPDPDATEAEPVTGHICPPVSRDPAAQLPLTIFFMVEPGPLEAQAHLLVSSLLVHCRDLFRMVGFCRDDRIDGLHPATVSYLTACGVDLRGIRNDFADGYPAGNKLIAAASLRADGWALFLDTDMCLMRDTSFMDVAVGNRPAVCLDSVTGWAQTDADYKAVAETLDFAGFPDKVRLWDGAVAHPTFNAGLVLFPPATRGGLDFGQRWLRNALILDNDPTVANKRPWLDTIALAGTVAQERHHRPLPIEWNCTTRLATEATRVLHYHGLRQLNGFGWVPRVNAILAASPSPYDTMAAFRHAHKHDMQLDGDIERRAMRHGMQTQ